MFGGVLVGNSSSGIIEAATFGIPVVNIGDRQAGRERNGNVVDVAWSAGEEASWAAVCELFVALGPRLDWGVGLGAGYAARARHAQRSGN